MVIILYKKNNYYQVDKLPSGMTYIANLIDNIEVDFNYLFESSKPVDYDSTYYVEAITRVYGDKTKSTILFEKSEMLLDNVRVNKSAIRKQEIDEKMETHQPLKPVEIVKKVLEKDYQAQEESELMLKDMGIGEEDQIQSISTTSIDKCKLVLDDEIEVSLSVDEYLQGNHLKKRKENDGTYSIILKNINEVIVK